MCKILISFCFFLPKPSHREDISKTGTYTFQKIYRGVIFCLLFYKKGKPHNKFSGKNMPRFLKCLPCETVSLVGRSKMCLFCFLLGKLDLFWFTPRLLGLYLLPPPPPTHTGYFFHGNVLYNNTFATGGVKTKAGPKTIISGKLHIFEPPCSKH